MKKARKMMAIALAALMAASIIITVNVRAEEYADGGFVRDWPNYGSATGEVVEVEDGHIRIATGESAAYFILTDATFILGSAPQIGDTVEGFYDSNRPMTMQYPPRYDTVVLVNKSELDSAQSVFVDRFVINNGELISADGLRRLAAPDPDLTTVVTQGGVDSSEWDWDWDWQDLHNRLLVVVYSISTRSMPPLIFAPQKIVLMYETAVHPGPAPIDGTDDDNGWESGFMGIVPPIADIRDDYARYGIVVNGVGVPFADPHTEGDAEAPTHVPLRAVVQALDPYIHVSWNSGTVTLDGAWGHISFVAGSNQVEVNGNTVTLSMPTVNVNGRVQVPLGFFRDVAGINNAYSEGGTVFIDNF